MRRHTFPFAAWVLLALLPVSAIAQANSDRVITVTGEGVVKVRPDMVEVRGMLKGAAPIAADAMKKFKQHREQLKKSLDELKIADLKVEFGGAAIISGSAVQQQAMMMGVVDESDGATPANLTVSETVKLQLTNVANAKDDEIFANVLKIVDAAKDNGLQLSEPTNQMLAMQLGQGLESNLAMFVIQRKDEMRKAAMKAAVANARARATDLAELTDAKLGEVRRIKEVSLTTKGQSETSESLMMQIYGLETSKPEHAFSSPNFGEIEVVAKLEVEFSIQ